jgi:hypothetical protein
VVADPNALLSRKTQNNALEVLHAKRGYGLLLISRGEQTPTSTTEHTMNEINEKNRTFKIATKNISVTMNRFFIRIAESNGQHYTFTLKRAHEAAIHMTNEMANKSNPLRFEYASLHKTFTDMELHLGERR